MTPPSNLLLHLAWRSCRPGRPPWRPRRRRRICPPPPVPAISPPICPRGEPPAALPSNLGAVFHHLAVDLAAHGAAIELAIHLAVNLAPAPPSNLPSTLPSILPPMAPPSNSLTWPCRRQSGATHGAAVELAIHLAVNLPPMAPPSNLPSTCCQSSARGAAVELAIHPLLTLPPCFALLSNLPIHLFCCQSCRPWRRRRIKAIHFMSSFLSGLAIKLAVQLGYRSCRPWRFFLVIQPASILHVQLVHLAVDLAIQLPVHLAADLAASSFRVHLRRRSSPSSFPSSLPSILQPVSPMTWLGRLGGPTCRPAPARVADEFRLGPSAPNLLSSRQFVSPMTSALPPSAPSLSSILPPVADDPGLARTRFSWLPELDRMTLPPMADLVLPVHWRPRAGRRPCRNRPAAALVDRDGCPAPNGHGCRAGLHPPDDLARHLELTEIDPPVTDLQQTCARCKTSGWNRLRFGSGRRPRVVELSVVGVIPGRDSAYWSDAQALLSWNDVDLIDRC